MQAYGKDLQSSWVKLNKEMEREAKTSREAQKVYETFQENSRKKGGGLYYANQIAEKLKDNHDALGEALKFLLARSGKYTVDNEGQILFDESVSDRDLDQYNRIIERVDQAMRDVEELDRQRLASAQQRISQAREYLK